MSTKIATLIEDGQSVVSLGEPVAFSWIDVMGVEPVEISAFVIGDLPEWDGSVPADEGSALVLVDGPTVRRMAAGVRAAEITGPADSAAYALGLLSLPAAFAAPVAEGLLYDVTELGGGPLQWAGQRIVADGPPANLAPVVEPVSQQRSEAAAVLEDSWSFLVDSFRVAMREVPHGDRDRFEGYLSQVFDPDSRMLGMQSVGSWIAELARALRGESAEEEE